MPVFVRPGASIPLYPEDVDCTDEMDMTKTTQLVIDEAFKGIWK
jgi:alpha-D-xyloside xylohydrolase